MFWNASKSLFHSGGANYMLVADLESAIAWYMKTFDIKRVKIALDDAENCVPLGFDEESCLFVLGPRGESSGELTARLFTTKVQKARDYLLSRGVSAGEVQQDEQRTRFFQVRDVEGNPIEISEEP